jgi:hypothetical protein
MVMVMFMFPDVPVVPVEKLNVLTGPMTENKGVGVTRT